MQNRVVITGIGAISALGNTAPELWAAIRAGECGISAIESYDCSEMSAKLAGEVKSDLSEYFSKSEYRHTDRFTQFALIAAREAAKDANLNEQNFDLNRVDTLVSSGIGGMNSTVQEQKRGSVRGYDRVSPHYIPTTIANIAAGKIAIEQQLRGDCSCIVSACASSAHALGEAMRHIRHGYADAVICGGSEATIIPLAVGGFSAMQALHLGSDPSRASIPFDAERSGFVMAEGAGMLVLESLEHAKCRGAKIYAELAGFGASCDAWHITAPTPDGAGAKRAMRLAFSDANITATEIGYINAHGTSTVLNDKCEAEAILNIYDSNRHTLPPVSSTKSMTGHLLGAAGAIEAIITALALRDCYLPATINYKKADPNCELDVIANAGRHAPNIQYAMSNSLGFGGHNVALVFKKYEF